MSGRRGRPFKDTVRTSITIERGLLSQLEILLMDGARKKIRYGALSTITNELYRQFINTVNKPGVDVVKFLNAYGVNIEENDDEQTGY